MSFTRNEMLRQAVDLIISNGMQFEVINALLQSLEAESKKANDDMAECKACLQAIRKINAGKNEAIDALCETR